MSMANDDRGTRRLLRRREKRAVEPLYDNSALRDNLNDEQAESILSWGADKIAAMVQFTAVLPDEDAQAVIESRATAVRQAVHWLNTAVAENIPTEDINLAQLWDALGHVVALPAELPHNVTTWWEKTQALSPEMRFQQLQALLQHPENWFEITASEDERDDKPPTSSSTVGRQRPTHL